MSRLILDAGAFIAFEKGDAAVRSRLAAARRLGVEIATPSPVIGQVWRDGRRQALLSVLLPAVLVIAPDTAAARRAGELLARSKRTDVVDALVAGLARDGDTILTSDVGDLRALVAAANTRAAVAAA
jgi:predicted nucleic acid-binding protein